MFAKASGGAIGWWVCMCKTGAIRAHFTCSHVWTFMTSGLRVLNLTRHAQLKRFTADHEAMQRRAVPGRMMRRRERGAEGREVNGLQQASSYQLHFNLTFSIWVTASWTEVNYSKGRRLLASTVKKNHQLCAGGYFQISSTRRSAPETAASSHLIEAHSDLMIWAWVFQKHLITCTLAPRGAEPSMWMSLSDTATHAHGAQSSTAVYFYIQLME